MSATRASRGARARAGLEHLRVAVVGAGAAGLTAAHTLKKLGYRSVTVFEQGDAAGGKTLAFEHGGRSYALGAVWVLRDYEVVNQLAVELGIALQPSRMKKTQVEADGRRLPLRDVAKEKYGARVLARSLLNYAKVRVRYAAVFRPGYSGADPALHVSFSEFAEAHGFAPLADLLRSFTAACGYGYYEEIPAQYILKLFNWFVTGVIRDAAREALSPRISPGFLFPTEGMQRLWTELAKTLDVRLRSEVTRLARTAQGVELTVNGEVQMFDRVIVTALLDQASTFMEFPADVAGMIKELRTYRFVVSLIEAEGLERQSLVLLYENTWRRSMGRVLAMASGYTDSNVFLAFQISDGSLRQEELDRMLEEDVAGHGGKILRVITKKTWAYFPHFGRALLDKGVYQRLEALQGKDGMYLAGSTMNFETLEDAARYARDLVIEHFSDKGAR
ncbi:FAD-dependent oxidoreductase [Sorangium sp. So ce291]|uniref:FAD-dependent oxidoreductase n=1 Tax=Sorangium sp. So ce291 TaxID=3133294 RepID=UPI003F5E86D5